MPISLERLKDEGVDYYMASWVGGELEMSPHCACGAELDETYYCDNCKRECTCKYVVCDNLQTLAMVQKFIHGNPNFKEFGAAIIEKA